MSLSTPVQYTLYASQTHIIKVKLLALLPAVNLFLPGFVGGCEM